MFRGMGLVWDQELLIMLQLAVGHADGVGIDLVES